MARKKAAESASKPKAGKAPKAAEVRIYTLDVSLLAGMVTRKFLAANPVVSRTILMRGDQTLEQLHEAIFKAYDRFDAHMYEFQFGKEPMEQGAARYGLFDDDDFEKPAGLVGRTRLDDLDLKPRRRFFYWFDFGDDWWHAIQVVSIKVEPPPGKLPRVIQRVGASPPQYPDEDELDDLA